MRVKIRNEHLYYAGFSIILLKQPLQFLIGPAYLSVLALGLILCFAALLLIPQGLKLAKKDRLIAGFVLTICILHSLLALIDVSGESRRSLWLYGLAQLLITVLFLHYYRLPQTWKFLKTIFAIALIIECTLALLQVSYYSTGIGLPPVFDEYESYSFVSGSFYNANDFSIFVAAYSMALYSCWMIEGKDNRGYLVAGLALIAVFVSMSRTAFVFMSLFASAVLLRSGKKVLCAPNMKSSLITLSVLASTISAVISLVGSDFLANTTVFERATARINQVGAIQTDESASIRSMVYVRLLENIPNLGLGTFSDKNYSKFFKYEDFALIKINPHSFVAEMSFLYGWLGLVTASGLIFFVVVGILKNHDIPIFMKLFAAGSLVFFQSVPSSILANTNFFLPYLLLVYCRRYLLTANPLQRSSSV